jgi:hypothetical protein
MVRGLGRYKVGAKTNAVTPYKLLRTAFGINFKEVNGEAPETADGMRTLKAFASVHESLKCNSCAKLN